MTSHAAVVARGMGKPCVSGCQTIEVDAHKVRPYEPLSACVHNVCMASSHPLTTTNTTTTTTATATVQTGDGHAP